MSTSTASAFRSASTPRTEPLAFGDLSRTPENHFVLHFHAAVYAISAFVRHLNVANGADPERALGEHPFLRQYLAESLQFMPDGLQWQEGTTWWTREIQAWEQAEAPRSPSSRDVFPLRTLTRVLGLTLPQRLAFVIVGVLEEDSRFGTLFAGLQAPLPTRRPTFELVNRAIQHMAPGGNAWQVTQPLLQHGLVDVVDRQAPRAEWALRVPPLLWEAARGEMPSSPTRGFNLHTSADGPELSDLVLDDAFIDQLQHTPTLIENGQVRTIVVRGTPGSDRRRIVQALARAVRRGIAHVRWQPGTGNAAPDLPPEIGPLCTLLGLMPVLETDLGPGDTHVLPPIRGYAGPVGVCTGTAGGFEDLEAAITLTVPPLSTAQRRELWQRSLARAQGGATPYELDAIASTFRLPGQYLRRTASSALRVAQLHGRSLVTAEDVREACRSLNHQHLDAHAEKLSPSGSWSTLVVGPSTAKRLHELERRCRHRETLLEHLGSAFGNNATPGVRALFAGPSGTGKTLAAKILAAEVGMDLYRVDLAAVLNKYVGETEKNLHRVLQTAEELDVILLLDEGDSLLGKRTDVRSANDRYANVETNYLLQRLEHYRGIVVVTTNLGDSIDPAFQRRMDITVDFQPPRAEERAQIWRLHLPEQNEVSARFLGEVATRCTLTGGQIRNASLHASLLALDDHGRVADTHVAEAVRSEYRKAGTACPLSDEAANRRERGVHRFLRSL